MKFFKKDELKYLWPFYGQNFLISITKVIMPFYILYFVDLNISLAAIALIWSLRSIIWFVFELPTGVIADKYGRKFSVLLWYFGKAVLLFLVPFAPNIWIIALLLWLDALFQTFFSGAENALVVDHIKEESPHLLDTFFIRNRIIKNIGYVIAPLLWWLIVHYFGMAYLWPVVSLGVFLGTLFLLNVREPRIVSEPDEEEDEEEFSIFSLKNIFSHAGKTFGYIWKHSFVLRIMTWSFLYRFVDEVSWLAWTPYLQEIGITTATIWYIFSIISIVSIVLPLFLEQRLSRYRKESIIAYSMLLFAIGFLLVGIIHNPIIIAIIFILANTIEQFFLPMEEALLHEHTPSKIRATMFSVKSMIESLAGIVGWPVAGILLWIISLQTGICISWTLILIIGIIYFFLKKREGDKQSPSQS